MSPGCADGDLLDVLWDGCLAIADDDEPLFSRAWPREACAPGGVSPPGSRQRPTAQAMPAFGAAPSRRSRTTKRSGELPPRRGWPPRHSAQASKQRPARQRRASSKHAGSLHARPHIEDDHSRAAASRRRPPPAARAPAATEERSATEAAARADCAAGRGTFGAVRVPGLFCQKKQTGDLQRRPPWAPQIQRHNHHRQRSEKKCGGKKKIHRTKPVASEYSQNDVIESGVRYDERIPRVVPRAPGPDAAAKAFNLFTINPPKTRARGDSQFLRAFAVAKQQISALRRDRIRPDPSHARDAPQNGAPPERSDRARSRKDRDNRSIQWPTRAGAGRGQIARRLDDRSVPSPRGFARRKRRTS